MKRVLRLMCVAALLGAGCAPVSGPAGSDEACVGKCDGEGSGLGEIQADLDKIAEQRTWEGRAIADTADLYTTLVKAGDQEFKAPTHVMDSNGDGKVDSNDYVRIIPYADEADARTTFADGETQVLAGMAHADGPLSQEFTPGEIGWAIKHHRMEHRTFDMSELGGPASAIKEHAKNQDTHIELIVGVDHAGLAGVNAGDVHDNAVISINSPQSYGGGRFDRSGTYPMIFVKPSYPEFIKNQGKAEQFKDNIRTMMVAFGAVADFPGEYNGGDPLGAYSPDKVRELTAKMVMAIAGDAIATDDSAPHEDARAWFKKDENLIYCAELAHVSASAGMIVPANGMQLMQVLIEHEGLGVGDAEAVAEQFAAYVEAHNRHESTPFTELNTNKRVAAVDITMAPDDLLPAAEYAPEPEYADALAFRPMTAGDIITTFLRTHIPRREMGEGMAQIQAKAFEAMKSGILENMDMDKVTGGLARNPDMQALAEKLKSLRQGAATEDDIAMMGEALEALESADAPEKLVGGLKMRKGFEEIFRIVVAFLAINWDTCMPADGYREYVNSFSPDDIGWSDRLTGEDQSPLGLCRQLNPDDGRDSWFTNFVQTAWGELFKGLEFEDQGYYRMIMALEGTKDTKGPLQLARDAIMQDDPANGLFVPPSLLHMVARGDWKAREERGGETFIHAFLGLDYVAHGMDYRYVKVPEGFEAYRELADVDEHSVALLGDSMSSDEGTVSGEVAFGDSHTFDLGEAPPGADLILVELQTTRGDVNLGIGEGTFSVCTSENPGLQTETCLLDLHEDFDPQYSASVQGAGAEESGEPGSDALQNEYTLTATALYEAAQRVVTDPASENGTEQIRFVTDLPTGTGAVEFWMSSRDALGFEDPDNRFGSARVQVYAIDGELGEGNYDEWVAERDPLCDVDIADGGFGHCNVSYNQGGGFVVQLSADGHTDAIVRSIAR